MVKNHKWHLVGPWYRWSSTEDPGEERTSRPILQKYADSNLVNEFLLDPQHSLQYLAEDRAGTGRRKVYLDTHNRFYLVVCALHCDAPGFPRVNREQVCEAGFVVRKRRTEVPEAIRPRVESLLHTMAFERARLARIERRRKRFSPSVGAMAAGGLSGLIGEALHSGRRSARAKYTARLEDARASLTGLLAEHGATPRVRGWHTTGPDRGQWRDLEEEMPATVEEHVYPLYPLIPDQGDPGHPSGHMTLWYGLLPVSSSDTDAASNPQLDDRSVYEVRCFVRRHLEHCPRTRERNDCPGEIVWSRPTETYQLAPHFDLLGTSNRMATIQAPDLNALRDQLSDPDFRMGQGMGLAVATPADSGLPVDVDGDGNPQPGAPGGLPSICFFAIPLITIVALFLLRLFLPIVVFLFGLWFLLRLKLCILPQISVDLGAELDLGLEGELALEADLSVAVKAKLDVVLAGLPIGMREAFQDEIDAGGQRREQAYRDLARMAIDQSRDFSGSGVAPELIEEIRQAIEDDPTLAPETSGEASLPDPAERLVFYPTRTLEEVLA